MHVTVTDGCISCGLCADEFPELFHLNDEGVAEPSPPPLPPTRRKPPAKPPTTVPWASS